WGVYSGMCLPRSLLAISAASRPRTLSVVSTTNQSRVTVSGFALNVFILSCLMSGGFKKEGEFYPRPGGFSRGICVFLALGPMGPGEILVGLHFQQAAAGAFELEGQAVAGINGLQPRL